MLRLQSESTTLPHTYPRLPLMILYDTVELQSAGSMKFGVATITLGLRLIRFVTLAFLSRPDLLFRRTLVHMRPCC